MLASSISKRNESIKVSFAPDVAANAIVGETTVCNGNVVSVVTEQDLKQTQ